MHLLKLLSPNANFLMIKYSANFEILTFKVVILFLSLRKKNLHSQYFLDNLGE